MFQADSVSDTRQVFFSSWGKYRKNLPLEPVEQQIVAVIIDHPEYHAILESSKSLSNYRFLPELGETNPFLHMGLHLAIRDQISTDRPLGIKNIYNNLLLKHKDPAKVEHMLIEVLAETLWAAQRAHSMPDEDKFISECNLLLRS